MAADENQKTRIFAFDALRPFAAVCVVYLHSTLSFTLPLWTGIHDLSAGRVGRMMMRESYELIHSFVLPLFFLVAGFLARRSLLQDGLGHALRQRLKHLVLPMLAAGLTLVPCVHILQRIGQVRAGGGLVTIESTLAIFRSNGDFWGQFGPHYLWFLLYLAVFSAVTSLLCRTGQAATCPGFLTAKLDDAVVFLCRSKWAPLILTIPGLIAVAFVRGPIIAEVGQSVVPCLPILLLYWMHFSFGWLMHRKAELLTEIASNWKLYLASGLIVWLIGTCVLQAVHSEQTDFRIPRPLGSVSDHTQSAFAGPLTSQMGCPPPPSPVFPVYQFMKVYLGWAIPFGLIGLALRTCTRPNPIVRYCADVSYWLYVAHVPLVMGIQIWMADWPVPWWLKLPVINILTIGILLLVYHYAVRATWVGVLLNGQRYPVQRSVKSPLVSVGCYRWRSMTV